jgi:plasmid stability protein
MATVTIQDIPDQLVAKLRARADSEHRTLEEEMVQLMNRAVADFPSKALKQEDRRKRNAERQADAWSRLAGRWISNLSVQEEIESILSARTQGREIIL